jgi:hypothetical protein
MGFSPLISKDSGTAATRCFVELRPHLLREKHSQTIGKTNTKKEEQNQRYWTCWTLSLRFFSNFSHWCAPFRTESPSCVLLVCVQRQRYAECCNNNVRAGKGATSLVVVLKGQKARALCRLSSPLLTADHRPSAGAYWDRKIRVSFIFQNASIANAGEQPFHHPTATATTMHTGGGLYEQQQQTQPTNVKVYCTTNKRRRRRWRWRMMVMMIIVLTISFEMPLHVFLILGIKWDRNV